MGVAVSDPVLVHPDDRVTRPMWCVLTRLRARPIGSEEWTVRAVMATHDDADRVAQVWFAGHAHETRLQVANVTIDLRGAS